MSTAITGVLLAGGLSQRMQGVDKAQLQWPPQNAVPSLASSSQASLTQHSLSRLAAQVDHVLLSSNDQSIVHSQPSYQVIADLPEFARQGPLAGLLSAGRQATTDWLCVAPVDCPALPEGWVAMLFQNRRSAKLAVAHDGERMQHAVMLLHQDLLDSIEIALRAGRRSIYAWLQQQSFEMVYFPDQSQAFANLNTPEDWAEFWHQYSEG